MFKHHRFTLELHDITTPKSGAAAPVAKPVTAKPAAPAGETAENFQATTAPGSAAAQPKVTETQLNVARQELATGKKDLKAWDADGNGDTDDAEMATMLAARSQARAEKPAGGAPEGFKPVEAKQETVPPIPPYDAADKSIKPASPEGKSKQDALKAQYAALDDNGKQAARDAGYDETKLNDSKVGPGTRASENALATLANKGATERNAAAQKAADEQNAAGKAAFDKAAADKAAAAQKPAEPAPAAPPPTTIAEVNAVNEKQQAEIEQLKVDADRDKALGHVKAWREGGNYEDAGKQIADFATRHPELVNEDFTKDMGDDQVRGFMKALEGNPKKAEIIAKLPQATRDKMVAELKSGWTSGEEYTMIGALQG